MLIASDQRLSRYWKDLSWKQECNFLEVLEVYLLYHPFAAWMHLSSIPVLVASAASIAMLTGLGRSSVQRRQSR